MKNSKRDKTVKNVKLKNSENLNPKLSVGKDAEKAKQFYWLVMLMLRLILTMIRQEGQILDDSLKYTTNIKL